MQVAFVALIRAFVLSSVLITLSVNSALAMQATIRWVDTAASESGFKIERLVSATGISAQIALTAANVTSFVDTNLLANTTYCYRVRAYNAAGNSAYSNQVCISTSVQKVRLSVSLIGSGTLTSSPGGINCPSDCTENYRAGTRVTLTPRAGSWTQFAGWGGACTGQGSTCVVTMTSTKNVTANFQAASRR
jgi:List-Bact-rpt repeat protein